MKNNDTLEGQECLYFWRVINADTGRESLTPIRGRQKVAVMKKMAIGGSITSQEAFAMSPSITRLSDVVFKLKNQEKINVVTTIVTEGGSTFARYSLAEPHKFIMRVRVI